MSQIQKSMVIWGAVAFIISIIMVTNNNASFVLAAGFFTKFFAVILGSAFGLAGALIGDAIRKFALPDGFITNGGMGSIIWTKIFWAIGPQSIGVFIGVALGCSIILHK